MWQNFSSSTTNVIIKTSDRLINPLFGFGISRCERPKRRRILILVLKVYKARVEAFIRSHIALLFSESLFVRI